MKQKVIKKEKLSQEKRLLSFMVMLAAITTVIFLTHTIIESVMNYDSEKIFILNYFTIQSNIIVALWLATLSVYMLTQKQLFKWSMNIHISSIVTTYILVTGIIYWIILVPVFYVPGETKWLFNSSNIWMHTTICIIAFLMQRYIKKLSNCEKPKLKLGYFFIYPVIYITMALVYAARGIYLYPMFNVDLLGWSGVALCIVAIALFFTWLYYVVLKGNFTFSRKKQID